MKYKLVICIGLLVLILTNSAQNVRALTPDEQNLRLLSSSEKGISFEVRVPWQEVELNEVVIDGSTYTKVSLPGWNAIGQADAPELPVMTATFAVPFGVELSLEVSPNRSHLMELDQSILPIAEQVFEQSNLFDPSLLNSPTQRLVYHPDEEIYTAEGTYPGMWAEITNEGIFRNQRLVGITVYPFQYQAQKNLLEIYESVSVDVVFDGENLSSTMSSVNDSEIFENLYEQAIINYESSIPWRRTELDSDLATQGSLSSNQTDWDVPSPGWRVNVLEEGFYKLTYSELAAANVPVNTLSLSGLQMFYMGSEIAIQIIDHNADGDFDPEDLIIFFASEVDNKYAAENVYWLTYSSDTQGLRMDSRDVSPDPESPSPIAEDFSAHLHFEENLNYASSIAGPDELERFVWGFISTGYSGYRQKTFEFNLPEKSTGAIETLKLALIGYTQIPTNPLDHRVVVKINGTQVADSSWDDRDWNILDIQLPTDLLTVGINELEISGPNTFFDVFYIDWFEIGIAQKFVTESDLLDFIYPEIGPRQFLISEFSTADLVAFDISDKNNPIYLTGMNILTVDENSFDVKLEDEIIADSRYWVSAKSNFLSPTTIIEDSPSNLSNTENQADYVLITHELLASAPELSNLINLRTSQGLQVMKVDVQDIYDEFNFGITNATAIKDFLAYTWSHWVKVPSVVVLVGDGHYNPKNYSPGVEGFGRTSFIPPYLTMVDATIGETASDNWYVTLEGEDNLPDMLIGRLAVNSVDEVGAFVNKIVDYEASLADGDWNLSVTLAADNLDEAGSFPYSSEFLRSCCIPDHYQQDRIYLGTTHSTDELARAALIAGINDGKLLVNYIGHGAYSEWAGWDSNPALSEPMLRASDVAGFTNAGKYPVVLAMTCAEGMFHFPHPLGSFQESMAEVITKAANKGAVASWSPTGWGLATGHDLLNRGFVTAALVNKVNTLGEATTSGLLNLWSSGNYLDLIDTYMIFGDPALVLKRGLTAISDEYQVNEDEILVVTDADGVLENDLNPENLPLTAELVSGKGPSFGALVFNGDGSFRYTPNPDFSGTDSFYYRIKANDGEQYSNEARVTIIVNPTGYISYLPMIVK